MDAWEAPTVLYFSSENIHCGNKSDSYTTTHPAFALPSRYVIKYFSLYSVYIQCEGFAKLTFAFALPSRYASLFPEYSFAFCGDTGQGDAALAARMIKV